MDKATLESIRARSDAKLRYAEIHLSELRARGGNGGTEFDRAFQESYLFHLLGAKDAFLAEINRYYSLGLDETNLTVGKLHKALKGRDIVSQQLADIYALENDQDSWLFHAKQMRDYCTHVSGVARTYHMGGPDHGKVFLQNPKTGRAVELHVLDAFAEWLSSMRTLLDRLRTSAITANAL